MIVFSDVVQAFSNLRAQKTRTLLTALGIVFGVGSVIGMMSIGAGAREESLRFIEQLGVRNILIDSRQAMSQEEFQQRRRSSPGLTRRDVRILRTSVDAIETISERKTLHPASVLPKPSLAIPELYGVRPSYAVIHSLQFEEGRFFDETDDESSALVCVLGESAKVNLLGYDAALGKFVKVNDMWLQVVGVLRSQLMAGAQNTGGTMQDVNNIIYIPFNSFQYRFWDRSAYMRDELDGIELRLKPEADSIEVAKIVTAALNSTHHDVQDFTVTIPAALLAQQQRTQQIFTYVMVAIAAISLLVGGIGIMNIVLATVLERTREIGIRRSIGARRVHILRQFLTESVLISVGGGILGVAFGFFL
jgi:putative ABC transport system permease protein